MPKGLSGPTVQEASHCPGRTHQFAHGTSRVRGRTSQPTKLSLCSGTTVPEPKKGKTPPPYGQIASLCPGRSARRKLVQVGGCRPTPFPLLGKNRTNRRLYPRPTVKMLPTAREERVRANKVGTKSTSRRRPKTLSLCSGKPIPTTEGFPTVKASHCPGRKFCCPLPKGGPVQPDSRFRATNSVFPLLGNKTTERLREQPQTFPLPGKKSTKASSCQLTNSEDTITNTEGFVTLPFGSTQLLFPPAFPLTHTARSITN